MALNRALDQYEDSITPNKPFPALLGAFVAGNFQITVPTNPALAYVRYFIDDTPTTAKHRNRVDLTTTNQNTPIALYYDEYQELSIWGIDPKQAGAVLETDPNAGAGGIKAVVAGTNVTVDNTDPVRPIVNVAGGGSTSITAPPLAAAWTFTNPGTATLTDIEGGVLLTAPAASGDDLRIATRPVVATPYHRTLLAYPMAPPSEFWFSGIVVRDSGTGSLISFGLTVSETLPLHFRIMKWTDENTYASDYTPFDFEPLYILPVYLHIDDDGTDITFGWSSDGLTPYPVFTVANNDFLTTINQAGFFLNANLTGVPDLYLSVRSWKES